MSTPEQLDNAVFTRERYFPSDGKAPYLYVCNLCLPDKRRMSKYKNLSKHRRKYHSDAPETLQTVELPLRPNEQSLVDYHRAKEKRAERW